jgi:hypothetical protein
LCTALGGVKFERGNVRGGERRRGVREREKELSRGQKEEREIISN